jgi:hypothetical protein
MTDAMIHVPTELHARAKEHAKRLGVFLNDFVATAISRALEPRSPPLAVHLPRSPLATREHCGNCTCVDCRPRKALEVLPPGRLKPEPWSLPAFYERPDYRAKVERERSVTPGAGR